MYNAGPYTSQAMNRQTQYDRGWSTQPATNQSDLYWAGIADKKVGWGTTPPVNAGGGGGGGTADIMNAQLKRDLFNQLFGGGGASGSGGAAAGVGGGGTPQSTFSGNVNFSDALSQVNQGAQQIGQSPVLSEQQIQERVNQMRARGDLSTSGIVQRLRDQLSGAGFGGDSPLLQQLAAQAQFSNFATSAAGENDLRFNAAQGNAEHMLQSQQAAASADNQRRQMALDLTGQRNQLIAALLGSLG